jgi:hypothetical protein
MSKIPTINEQRLANLNPTGIDEDFLSRLTASAEGIYADLSEDEAAFESKLRAIRPTTIPPGLSTLLLDTLGDTPFAVDGKIVLFNKAASGVFAAGKPKRSFTSSLAAAAAVALLGAIAAFMVPTDAPDVQVNTEDVSTPYKAPTSSPVAPVGFQRNLSDTRDEGVVWRGKNQPHRVLRLTYTDHVTVKDADGNPVRIERPRVEYMIIPEKID